MDRVIMHKGALRDPDKLYFDGKTWKRPSTATSYCWLIWLGGVNPQPFHWIAPGTRKRLTKPGDYPTDGGTDEARTCCQDHQENRSLADREAS